MNKEYLTRLIFEYNPQFQAGPGDHSAIKVPDTKRDLYAELSTKLRDKGLVGIIGLRRTGKTVLMRQLMAGMGKDAAYFSFDEEETQTKESMVFVLDYILNNIRPHHIFLDEVHYVPDWEGVVKRYYDQKGLSIIVSGSESFRVGKAKTALTGRLDLFHLSVLTFKEFMVLRGIPSEIGPVDIKDRAALKALYDSLLPKKELLEKEFIEYLYKGAFPELAVEEDPERIQRYIRDMVVKKVVHHDIPAIFNIQRKALLFDLFVYLCETSSEMFDNVKLGGMLGADQDTIKEYIFYLMNANLLTVSENYSGSPAKRMRRSKKAHVVHPSVALAFLGKGRELLVDKLLGNLVESLCAGKYFWRQNDRYEVDIIDLAGGKPFPIEVKFRRNISNDDLGGLLKFMQAFGAPEGLVVTKDLFDEKKINGHDIHFVPAWLYLLATQRGWS
jgi:hypothetical protein